MRGELTDQVVGVVLHIVLGRVVRFLRTGQRRSRHQMLGFPRSSKIRYSLEWVVVSAPRGAWRTNRLVTPRSHPLLREALA